MLPTPTGTVLWFKTPSDTTNAYGDLRDTAAAGWQAYGCVTAITYSEESKTSEPDVITNAISSWSGSVVTSKTRKISIEGLFRHTPTTGGEIPWNELGADADAMTTGNQYWIKLQLPVAWSNNSNNYSSLFVHFTTDNNDPDTTNASNVQRFVVLNREISFSGSDPVKFSLQLGVAVDSLC